MERACFFKGLLKRNYHNFTHKNLTLHQTTIIGILPKCVDPEANDEVRISAAITNNFLVLVAMKKMLSFLSSAPLEKNSEDFNCCKTSKRTKNLPHIKHFVCDFYGDCIVLQG